MPDWTLKTAVRATEAHEKLVPLFAALQRFLADPRICAIRERELASELAAVEAALPHIYLGRGDRYIVGNVQAAQGLEQLPVQVQTLFAQIAREQNGQIPQRWNHERVMQTVRRLLEPLTLAGALQRTQTPDDLESRYARFFRTLADIGRYDPGEEKVTAERVADILAGAAHAA